MKKLKNALINCMRKRITDPAGRGTDKIDTFQGNGAMLTFSMSASPICYVSSVSTAESGTMQLLTDYEIDFGSNTESGIITFKIPPIVSSGNNITVNYRYGVNWIYDDQPHVTAEMPRISVLNIGGEGETAGGVGDTIILLEPNFRIGTWIRDGKKYTISGRSYSGSKLLDYINTSIQDAVRLIRRNDDIGGLIDIRITEPVYTGLDEEYELKRTEATIRTNYQKNY